MAVQTKLHGERARLVGERHAVDFTMTTRAAHAFGDMDGMVEIDVLGQVVDAVPYERLVIGEVGHRGDGVAEGPVYVPYTLPGEIVEAEAGPGHPDRRQLLRVERASAERIEPICPHFGVCGGCALQHWDAGLYRIWKRDLVVTALRQAGIGTAAADLIDAHGEGRRRAVFHARRSSHDVLT